MNSRVDRPSERLAIVESSLAAVLPHLATAPLAGKKLFVTGGTGFFGCWLLAALARLNRGGAGIRATVLSRDPARFLRAQPRWRDEPWLGFVAGDVRDFEGPAGPIDLVIHAATETSAAAHAEPAAMFDGITAGSRRVLDFAVRAGATRILLASSGAVYRPTPAGVERLAEDAPLARVANPLSDAYGEGKRAMEAMGAEYHRQHGIEPVIARCFAFSGPGLPLDGHYAIGNFVRDALFGEEVRVAGDGTPQRSYLHGADLAVWLLQLLGTGEAGRAYNVGSDRAISIGQLASLVQQLVAPRKDVRLQQPGGTTQGPRQRYVPSIALARESLGLDTWTPLEDSIRQMAAFARP